MLFFVISGYCITAAAFGALVSGKTVWRYSFERVRRIYPPYLATVVLNLLSTTAISYALAIIAGRIFYLLVERRFISKRQVSRHVAEHVS